MNDEPTTGVDLVTHGVTTDTKEASYVEIACEAIVVKCFNSFPPLKVDALVGTSVFCSYDVGA